MEKQKEYAVSFTKCEQVSPDDFELVTKMLKVTSETTMAEIETFYRKYCKSGFMEGVKITELQTIDKTQTPQP